ncbi:MAG: hypothetical protein AAFU41_05120 [Pseudomonadota bacterium]
MQRFLTHVYWTCPECGHTNSQEADAPSLNFMAEKTSDIVGDDYAELTCDGCETTFSGHAWSNQGEVRFEMEELKSFEVQGDMPMYEPDPEDLYLLPPPDDPHGIAREALDGLRNLIDAGNDARLGDPQFRNRLVFSSAIAVLEAYFGDTIRNVVQRDRDALVRFATGNDVMRKTSLSVTMSDVEADSNVLGQTVEDRLRKAVDANLRGVLYHNLQKVIAIYKDAAGIELAAQADDLKELFRYMELRHDCVHRNGSSQDGKKHTVFDEAFVTLAIERVARTIDNVEDQVSNDMPF